MAMSTILNYIKSYFPKEEQASDNSIRYKINGIGGKQREYELATFVRQLAEQIEFQRPHSIAVLPQDRDPFVSYTAEAIFVEEWDSHRIYYSYLLLLEPEDIPLKLRLECEDDPRINSDAYIKEFTDWFQEFLDFKKEHITPSDKDIIRRMLRLTANPEEFKAAKKFILAHELGHLFYKHELEKKKCLEEGTIYRKVISAALSIFGTVACNHLTDSVIPSLLIGICLFKITEIALHNLESLRLSRKNEKEADLFAIKHIGTIGAIPFFQKRMQHTLAYRDSDKRSWYESIYLKIVVDSKGSDRFSILDTHPTDSQRIEYITSYSKTNNI